MKFSAFTFPRPRFHRKLMLSINDLFSKYDQTCSFLRIWSHLLKKPLMESIIFCAVHFIATNCTAFPENMLHRSNITFTLEIYKDST